MTAEENNFGLASFILGVLSAVFSLFIYPGIILGILGLIFGIVQTRKKNNNWAIWGIVLSIAGVILSIVIVVNIVLYVLELQNIIATCTQNPSAPGCAEIASMVVAK